jgi:hypothetical protein
LASNPQNGANDVPDVSMRPIAHGCREKGQQGFRK